jgi:hypothetical protein
MWGGMSGRYVIEIRTTLHPDTWGYINDCATRQEAEQDAARWWKWSPPGFSVSEARIVDTQAIA